MITLNLPWQQKISSKLRCTDLFTNISLCAILQEAMRQIHFTKQSRNQLMRLLVLIATLMLCGSPLTAMQSRTVSNIIRSMCSCGKKGELQCSGCKLERYCSSSCQNGDWKRHKSRCKFLQNCKKAIQAAHKKKQYKKAKNDPKLFKVALDKLDKELIKALIGLHGE